MKLWLSLLLTSLAVALRAEDAKPAPPPQSPAPETTPAEPPDWRMLSARGLKTEVQNRLYASKFKELDAMIEEINWKQMRFLDGGWKLQTFLDSVSLPRGKSDSEGWKETLRAPKGLGPEIRDNLHRERGRAHEVELRVFHPDRSALQGRDGRTMERI